jgi:hypothetical protein
VVLSDCKRVIVRFRKTLACGEKSELLIFRKLAGRGRRYGENPTGTSIADLWSRFLRGIFISRLRRRAILKRIDKPPQPLHEGNPDPSSPTRSES